MDHPNLRDVGIGGLRVGDVLGLDHPIYTTNGVHGGRWTVLAVTLKALQSPLVTYRHEGSKMVFSKTWLDFRETDLFRFGQVLSRAVEVHPELPRY